MKIPRYEYAAVSGSRKVIKDPLNDRQEHFYDFDLWTWYGNKIADLIPEGWIVYGELIGYLPGTDTPLQTNYTYDCSPGECELYVYRVATINAQGTLADLSWDGVKEFCTARGLKWTPELIRMHLSERGPDDIDWDDESPYDWIQDFLERIEDRRYAELTDIYDDWNGWVDPMVPLSDPKSVDEGVCLRQDGIVPTILKAKSAVFLQHETKLLDKDELDIESAA